MRKITKFSIVFSILLLLFTSCSKKDVKEPFAKVGRKTYSMKEFKSFEQMKFYHPVLNKDELFPGKKSVPTLFVETAALLKEAKKYKSQLISQLDWEWMSTYLPGQFYLRKVVQQNMGFTNDELKGYYDQHKAKILIEDSLSGTSFNGLKPTIIKHMFLSKFPPTDEYKSGYSAKSEENILTSWYDYQKKNVTNLYRDIYYKEIYGLDFPEKQSELFGEGKLITQKEVEVVVSWLPESEQKKSLEGGDKNSIIGFMINWKIFSQIAEKKGYSKTGSFKAIKSHFLDYELVRYYINSVLPQTITAPKPTDKDNFIYSIWDKKGKSEVEVDSTLLNRKIEEVTAHLKKGAIDKLINSTRASAKVEFLQESFVDNLDMSAAEVASEADSMLQISRFEKSKRLYQKLTDSYIYTEIGKEAFKKLAEIYSDEKNYTKSVEAYRNYLLYSNNRSEWCSVYFMIAYTYGEQIKNLPLAASNYRWILEKNPDCDLADDAEFMYLHLGEPMVDVDDLRDETVRQGKTSGE
jgi:tetratricopeptide (TPR) repeat protein